MSETAKIEIDGKTYEFPVITGSENEKAIEVLDYCMTALPLRKVPYDPYVADIIEAYFSAEGDEKAVEMTRAFCDYYFDRLDYYLKQDPYIFRSAEFEIQSAIQYTSRVANACLVNGKSDLAEEINKKLENYYMSYASRMTALGETN